VRTLNGYIHVTENKITTVYTLKPLGEASLTKDEHRAWAVKRPSRPDDPVALTQDGFIRYRLSVVAPTAGPKLCCNCKGWQKRQTCRHTQAMQALGFVWKKEELLHTLELEDDLARAEARLHEMEQELAGAREQLQKAVMDRDSFSAALFEERKLAQAKAAAVPSKAEPAKKPARRRGKKAAAEAAAGE
jgi:hypothetical protein